MPDPCDSETWLTLHNNDTHTMESTITEIPPDLEDTPYYQPEGVTALYLADDTYVGNLDLGVHTPEPATLALLALGGFALRRRRRK